MIILKSSEELKIMRQANRITDEVLCILEEMIRPGLKTIELDRVAEEYIRSKDAKPAFKGYMGYQHTLCTSVNEEVVHGIPGDRILQDGDIISIDCGVYYKGFYGDHAWSYAVGNIDNESKKLLEIGVQALMEGISKAVISNRLYDISAAIQNLSEKNGYSIVRDYVGHGIGRELHEEPQVPNFGECGTGIKLRSGLTLALEPMINIGTSEVKVLNDEWTVVTKDGKRSAHFEHTIVITEDGPEILSKR